MARSAKPERPAARARAEQKARSRVALLDAGMELIREQGLDAPSLDAICGRAGYTRGAFYVHFADRDDFIAAVMDRVGAAFLDSILVPGDDDDDLTAVMQRFAAAVASGSYPLIGDRGVRPHQLLAACARSPTIRAQYVKLVEDATARIGTAVSRSQAKGMLRDDVDAERVAAVLMAAIVGAQTLLDLGVAVDVGAAGQDALTMLAPPAEVGRGTGRS